ncbi:IS3 family transposase [Streptomyces sp. GD-15H]|uniref:IS3 family transposase n=1 Tax=Streptomyces sp. GD-15H TaxID=3129112 RepID=UPI00324FBFE8
MAAPKKYSDELRERATRMAVEAFNSLFKAELIRNKGPWTGIDDVEIAVAEYIDWFNRRRLHGELGHLPPAEYEALHTASPASELTLKTS